MLDWNSFLTIAMLGGGGQGLRAKSAHIKKQGLQIQIHIGWAGGLKNAMESFQGTIKNNE